MVIICEIEEMEYKQQEAKAGAWSTGLEGRVWKWDVDQHCQQ
jgi:hypothetical protein